MTEYLVSHRGRWDIVRAGAMSNKGMPCSTCHLEGRTPILNCEECAGTGKPTPSRIRLAWFDRSDAFVCFADEEDEVRELPS